MPEMKHAKGFPHDPTTGLPLTQWTGDEVTPEEHIEAGNTRAVDPGVDLSVLNELDFPTNPPELPTPEAVEEVYGLHVIRDIPFASWHSDAEVRGLVERIADHRGIPMMDGVRQDTGDRTGIMPMQDKTLPGPYVSQFLMHDVPAGPYRIERRVRTKGDYGAKVDEAALMESGMQGYPRGAFSVQHISHTPRSLARAVENDYPGQHWIHAWLILMNEFGQRAVNHPDQNLDQYDWCDGGLSDLAAILHEVINRAMRVTWAGGKWVHKHIRPAALGAYIENARSTDPVMRHYRELEFVKRSRQKIGNFLLPVASPNGHPGHGEFWTGHDTCEGAGSYLTRAFFDPTDTTPWPDHVVTAPTDPAGVMTIGSEALKQADNLGAARRGLGVHWFYSSICGRAVGEKVAQNKLREMGRELPELVWVPLWLETVERLGLDTSMPEGHHFIFDGNEEEE